MSTMVISLLLLSALIHAGWNALVRSGTDRLWSICVISLAGGITALPFAAMVEPPTQESWPYMLASSLLQVGYCLFLVRAYRDGELAKVYPIARGSAPLLVTIGAALFAAELPNIAGLAGIALVSLGIGLLAIGKGSADVKSILAALSAGCFIAGYMLVDGLGVRISASPIGYAAWQAVLGGFLIAATFVIIRRKAPIPPRNKEGAIAVTAGVVSLSV